MKATIIAVIVAVGLGGLLLFAANNNDNEQSSTTTSSSSSTEQSQAPQVADNEKEASIIQSHIDGAVVKSTVDATDKQEVDVEINDFYFDATILKVKKGTTITWTNQGNIRHDVTLASDSPNSFEGSELLGSGETHQVTLEEVGTYLYFCSPHPTQMRAAIEVVE